MAIEATRRDFLAGAGAAVAGIGACALATNEAFAVDNYNAVSNVAVEHAVDGWVETENTAPIPPISEPTEYDIECDVVVVGGSGGGLVAANRLAREGGMNVVLLEKAHKCGGSTSQAAVCSTYGGITSVYGDWGLYGTPYDLEQVIETKLTKYAYACDPDLIRVRFAGIPEAMEYIYSLGVPLVDYGLVYGDGTITGQICHETTYADMGMVQSPICDDLCDLALEAGVDLHTMTPVNALITNAEGRVVGVRAIDGEGNELYVHAPKAVVLMAGGMGANRDMMLRYVPYLAQRATITTMMPTTTGECIRMGLGLGADMTGYDTFSIRDGGLQSDDGFVFRSMFEGGEALCRQPWLGFDETGKRMRYFSTDDPDPVAVGYGESWMCMMDLNAPGGIRYVVFDGNYEQNVESFSEEGGRILYTPENPPSDNMANNLAICDVDWHDGLQRGLDEGFIKRADSLEELAELLRVPFKNLQKAVDEWNAMCDEGENGDCSDWGYKPEWLHKIENPPFFGARSGAAVQGTGCGLKVDTDLRVITSSGDVIPGLYAGWQCAGGMSGEFNWFQDALVSTSYAGGWIAANAVIKNETGEASERQVATGSAIGYGGEITATVAVENGQIVACQIGGGLGETRGVGGKEAILDGTYAAQVMAAQGADIDGIAGATLTNRGVKAAVTEALAQL